MSKQVFIKHVVRTKNSLNFTAFIQECSFLLLVFQSNLILIMELDCESELTPLLSTRLKEPIHSGAKFFLKVKFVFNVGDFTKSPIGEVSCHKNLIFNMTRIYHIMGWILIRIGGSYLSVQNSALIVELYMALTSYLIFLNESKWPPN